MCAVVLERRDGGDTYFGYPQLLTRKPNVAGLHSSLCPVSLLTKEPNIHRSFCFQTGVDETKMSTVEAASGPSEQPLQEGNGSTCVSMARPATRLRASTLVAMRKETV